MDRSDWKSGARRRLGVVAVAVVSAIVALGRSAPVSGAEPPRIVVHYMPWYVARPYAKVWGWHWTMNAFDPEKPEGGHRPIASHYDPMIGPYDSADPAVVEYQLGLMKIAGIDGIVVDWYGLSDRFDYPILHRNTAALFPAAEKLGLKVAICFEDQTIPKLVELGDLAAKDRVAHAKGVVDWLKGHWFREPSYLKIDGRPVLLSFGSGGLSDAEWSEVLPGGAGSPIYLSEHRRRPSASGAFDWPIPNEGLAAVDRFLAASKDWPVAMPAAFPRFHDIYAEAKLHASYGRIGDDGGRTFETTLKSALASRAPLVQVVTWNDWGEGTQVEPSKQFGYRDLETIQRLRRQFVEPGFGPGPDDLRLPARLHALRGEEARRPALKPSLDEAARLLGSGRLDLAAKILDRAEGH